MSYAATQVSDGGLDRLYDSIEADFPGVIHAMVQKSVWDSIEYFCTYSTFWRELVAWQMPPGTTVIDLNPVTTDIRATTILKVFGPSDAVTVSDPNAYQGNITYRLKPPAILIDTGAGTLTRYGTAWVICKPKRLSSDLPGWFDDWFEAINAGARARLCAQPAKPYSSPQMASVYAQQARAYIQQARAQVMYDRQGDTPRFPYFARGRPIQVGGWWGGGGNVLGGGEKPDAVIDQGSDRLWLEDLSGVFLLEDGAGFLQLEDQPPSGLGAIWGGGAVWQ